MKLAAAIRLRTPENSQDDPKEFFEVEADDYEGAKALIYERVPDTHLLLYILEV